jgi:two-component system sensor histidine kinase UhpB
VNHIFSETHQQPDLAPDWIFGIVNYLERCLFFVAVAKVVATARARGEELERAVVQRTLDLTIAQQALRKLAAQLSEAEAEERRRVAHDIHDSLSQTLSVVKLSLETAQSQAADNPALRNRLSDLVRLIDGLITQTRTMTFELYPSMLEDLGLAPALEWFIEGYGKRAGVEILVREDGAPRHLARAMSDYLFRAIRELLSNSVEHGRASDIVVSLHWQEDRLRIVIDDNGQGFDPQAKEDQNPQRGLGLRGIRERILSWGGELRIESSPGAGARVMMELATAQDEPATAGTVAGS